jgi:hypothetical protein
MKICANQSAYIKEISDDIKQKLDLVDRDGKIEHYFALMQENKIREILTTSCRVDKLAG